MRKKETELARAAPITGNGFAFARSFAPSHSTAAATGVNIQGWGMKRTATASSRNRYASMITSTICSNDCGAASPPRQVKQWLVHSPRYPPATRAETLSYHIQIAIEFHAGA